MQIFTVPEMSCGHCVRAISEAVRKVDPAARVEVDLDTKRVTVESQAPAAAIRAALEDAGYDSALVSA